LIFGGFGPNMGAMTHYSLPHDLAGEQQRLKLMSALLDPLERAHIERLGVKSGWRCLELGAGNGSIARILAELVAPSGCVVASDIDVRYMADLGVACLEVRRLDVMADAIEDRAYDLVVARALLHHLPGRKTALERMIGAVKPGGAFLSIEPDMLPCTVAEPESMRAFWQAWLKWSERSGIDYYVGRKISAWLDSLGMEAVAGEGDTILFNGGSEWAQYWTSTVRELAPSLLDSGDMTQKMLEDFYSLYEDPHYWTSVITFTASSGRKPA
jgi:SAM-dependent methyltransferase